MSDPVHQKILLACLNNSHGDYEFHWLNSQEQKDAVKALVKDKLITRTMGDGTAKGFTSRLVLTERGREEAIKLKRPKEEEETA